MSAPLVGLIALLLMLRIPIDPSRLARVPAILAHGGWELLLALALAAPALVVIVVDAWLRCGPRAGALRGRR